MVVAEINLETNQDLSGENNKHEYTYERQKDENSRFDVG